MDKFYYWLNKFLLLDVLLVFIFFIWFLVAIVFRSGGLDLPMEIWQSLWMPVIQPALGLVMLGAITSGAARRLVNKKKT
jgi:hypothetical protein